MQKKYDKLSLEIIKIEEDTIRTSPIDESDIGAPESGEIPLG